MERLAKLLAKPRLTGAEKSGLETPEEVQL